MLVIKGQMINKHLKQFSKALISESILDIIQTKVSYRSSIMVCMTVLNKYIYCLDECLVLYSISCIRFPEKVLQEIVPTQQTSKFN